MSWPSKTIVPSVISRPGWPMTALARVDLPEPLGPISAWISPERTVRSTPLRICLSPALTWRLVIWSSAMSPKRGGCREARAAPRVNATSSAQRRALQRLDDAELHARPQQLGGAVLPLGMRAGHARAFCGVGGEALHRRDRALEREHDLVHRDLLGRARQHVAAVRAAGRRHQLRLLQQRGDALQVRQRQPLGGRDRLQRDRRAVTLHAQLDQQPDAVLGFRREDHCG